MSKRVTTKLNCFCCGTLVGFPLVAPVYGMKTVAKYKCANCEGTFHVKITKQQDRPKGEFYFELMHIDMTEKTRELYQEKRDQFEGKPVQNPYDKMRDKR